MKVRTLLFENSIYDYLVWEPTGIFKYIADKLDMYSSVEGELYRGISKKELSTLLKFKRVASIGYGNTRNVVGSYVSSDIKLAARFALVNYRDKGNGILLILDRNKLPDLKSVDSGNYITSYIPIEALKQVIDLQKL